MTGRVDRIVSSPAISSPICDELTIKIDLFLHTQPIREVTQTSLG